MKFIPMISQVHPNQRGEILNTFFTGRGNILQLLKIIENLQVPYLFGLITTKLSQKLFINRSIHFLNTASSVLLKG